MEQKATAEALRKKTYRISPSYKQKEFMPQIESIRLRRFIAIFKRDFLSHFIVGAIMFIIGYALPFILARRFA